MIEDINHNEAKPPAIKWTTPGWRLSVPFQISSFLPADFAALVAKLSSEFDQSFKSLLIARAHRPFTIDGLTGRPFDNDALEGGKADPQVTELACILHVVMPLLRPRVILSSVWIISRGTSSVLDLCDRCLIPIQFITYLYRAVGTGHPRIIMNGRP